jgi:hypothetical protein
VTLTLLGNGTLQIKPDDKQERSMLTAWFDTLPEILDDVRLRSDRRSAILEVLR